MMDVVAIVLLAALIGSFAALEVRLVRATRGGWRWAALAPAVAVGVWGLVILVSVLVRPTSHNLWPLEMLLCLAGGLVYLGLLSLVRKFAGRRPPPR